MAEEVAVMRCRVVREEAGTGLATATVEEVAGAALVVVAEQDAL